MADVCTRQPAASIFGVARRSLHHSIPWQKQATSAVRARAAGKRRWDDPPQQHVEAVVRSEMPWQDAHRNRDAWTVMEVGFVARVIRRPPKRVLPGTRGLLRDTL